MNTSRDSIFISSLRIFFKVLFAVIGFTIGLVVILLIVAMFSSSDKEINLKYSQEIAPNAEGSLQELTSTTPAILEIAINGIIGLEDLTTEAIQRQLIESRYGKLKDDRVKALFLHLSTPGGTVVDADGIYRALKEYKKKYNIPVYAYVDGIAASGGMYVAAAADKIFANDTSLVGSVGVIIPTFLNFSQLLEKFGVQTVTLSAGIGKDEMNPLRPWKPGEETNYQNLVNYYYEQFVNILTENRTQINKEKLIQDYGAKVFPAAQAESLGFVDHAHSSRNEALKQLVADIGLEGKEYQVIKLESKNWLVNLFKSENNSLFTGKIVHQIKFGDYEPELMNKYLYLYIQ